MIIHSPIFITNLEFSLPHKTCFDGFSTQISHGARIAIIGRNGSGKSTLLKILQGKFEANGGSIKIPDDATFGYVPQIIEEFDSLSGGQRLNEAVTSALSVDPNILLLDEPTNHLDYQNRKSLMRMLKSYPGTLIIVSHDTELLRNCVDTIWHIDQGKIHIFSGNYDDYMREKHSKRKSIEQELARLSRKKKDVHHELMREQERASKSKAKGAKSIEQRKWPTIVSKSKATKAEETSGRKRSDIADKKQNLNEQLSELHLPEIILPKFSITSAEVKDYVLVSISEGEIGYKQELPILTNINLSLSSKERIAVTGNNGSGKSTLVKTILGDPNILKSGNWHVPKQSDIGYLDQHYATLISEKTVLTSISELVPSWTHAEIRQHLNNFLFRKNEEVNCLVSQLSGGEKARLSLAQIAAKTPKLLILDEITNNLELETRQHVIEILKSYPGAMILISHDQDFLQEIGVTSFYSMEYNFHK